MGSVIGDLLPLAMGVAISPIPIIAVILMLMSQRAAVTSLGFMVGWVLGVAAVTVVLLLLVGQTGGTSSEPSTASAVIKLVLGCLCFAVAGKQWRGRPRDGEEAELPKWMSAIDTFTFAKALGLGLLLSALNPKNLIMAVGAGTTIGAGHLSVSGNVISVLVFTIIAVSTVAGPVICFFLARDRVAESLGALHHWLEQNNATMMAVLMLVIGMVLLGKGIGALTA